VLTHLVNYVKFSEKFQAEKPPESFLHTLDTHKNLWHPPHMSKATPEKKWKIQKARLTGQVVLFHDHDGYPHVCKKIITPERTDWWCLGCGEKAPAAFVTAHNLSRI
jgi:hypothetical protein